MTIPEYKEYQGSTSSMTRDQFNFFKQLEQSLNNGEYIEIKGNISYIFVFIYRLINNWDKKGYENVYEFLLYLSEIYSHEDKITEYCRSWAYECLLGLGNYEEYLEKTEPETLFKSVRNFPSDRLNIQEHIGLEANHLDVLTLQCKRKTSFIKDNNGLYKEKILEVFEDYVKQNGPWYDSLKKWTQNKACIQRPLFPGIIFRNLSPPVAKFDFYLYGTFFDNTTINELSKKAENLAREEMGIPALGEGWVSETTLFKNLEAEFAQTKVIQHGQPKWLGRQHFDIWFPYWKIAVEFHGPQHFEPVDFFGGKEAYKKNVKRDEKKADLAHKHGVILFVVKEGYDYDSLCNHIKKISSFRKIIPPQP